MGDAQKKITVNLDSKIVENLKRKSGEPTAQTIRRSLKLMELLNKLQKEGFDKLVVENENGEKKEIIIM